MAIDLSLFDLTIAALLVVVLAFCSLRMKLGVGRQLLIAAARTVIQLTMIGFILGWIFTRRDPEWILVIGMIMVLIGGAEVVRRQHRKLTGWWGYGTGTISMFISSFFVSIIALTLIISADPWYLPQYSIPLLGMMLGNTMNGISLGLDRLTQTAWQQREVIEARLILGQDAPTAMSDIKRDSLRAALTPIMNAMAIIGLVSLPGMMTGQILAGSSPMKAVKYQILIMFLIAAGTGMGSMAAVLLAARRLFDRRHRLRLDRLVR